MNTHSGGACDMKTTARIPAVLWRGVRLLLPFVFAGLIGGLLSGGATWYYLAQKYGPRTYPEGVMYRTWGGSDHGFEAMVLEHSKESPTPGAYSTLVYLPSAGAFSSLYFSAYDQDESGIPESFSVGLDGERYNGFTYIARDANKDGVLDDQIIFLASPEGRHLVRYVDVDGNGTLDLMDNCGDESRYILLGGRWVPLEGPPDRVSGFKGPFTTAIDGRPVTVTFENGDWAIKDR
jgi:hypothetical protein